MDLTTGNVHQKLARFAGPVIIFALFNQLYVIADSVIVARFAGEQALSVIASTAAVISVANCLINGAAAGCHILIGRAAGEKNEEKYAIPGRRSVFSASGFPSFWAVFILSSRDRSFRWCICPHYSCATASF